MTSDREMPVPDAAIQAVMEVADQGAYDGEGDPVADVRAIAGPVVAAVLADSVALVERAIREETERDPEDKYTGVEALQVCSGHLLGLLKLYAGGEAAVEALRAAEEERQP